MQKSDSFRAVTRAPLNGSPDPQVLVSNDITPVTEFFVRNHGDPPATVDATGTPVTWSLSVTGLVRHPFTLTGVSVLDAAGEPRVSVAASLQCAGNRRSSLQGVKPIVDELPWEDEAIGNAVWEGVQLADLLRRAEPTEDAAHVWFTGAESLSGKHEGRDYGGSIPLAKALHPATILADRMNGAPLTAHHGAPLRVVVPGFVGARSVKWLKEIRVEHAQSSNHFQRAYSVGDTALDEFPVSCAFGDPVDGAAVSSGTVRARGWSITGGERTVKRVEVSSDGGAIWADARFLSEERPFVWRLWEATCAVTPGTRELVCRATDSDGRVQPDSPHDTWNTKGYLNNCWDRITIRTE